jgi:hypothetical protein
VSKKVSDYAKPDVKDRVEWLCVEATLVLADVILWARAKRLPVVISDAVTTLSEDQALKRTSSTHREGRAFDISTRGWDKESIDECVRVFGFKYRSIAALGQDGSPRLVYFHNAGTGDHLHFQVAKRFSMPLQNFDRLQVATK